MVGNDNAEAAKPAAKKIQLLAPLSLRNQVWRMAKRLEVPELF